MLEVTAAILSSLFFNVSLVVQSIDAERTPSGIEPGPWILLHLARQRVWLCATFLMAAAYVLELYALSRLPLTLVQPIIGAGVLILPAAAFLVRRQSPSTPVIVAVAVTALGVGILGTVVPREAAVAAAPPPPLLFATAGAAALVYWWGLRTRSPAAQCTVAGSAYGCTGLLSKLIAQHWNSSLLALAFCAAVFGAIGFIAEMSAVRKLSPTTVGPVVLAFLTVIPVLGGRLFLSETWPNLWMTIFGLTLTVAAAAWLARHVTVAGAAGQANPESAHESGSLDGGQSG